MFLNVIKRLTGLWDALTHPFPVVIDPLERHQSQLMASLFLCIALICGIFLPTSYLTRLSAPETPVRIVLSLGSSALLGLSYYLSRRGHYRLVGWMVLLYGSAVIFSTTEIIGRTSINSLYYLLALSYFASIFISLKATIALICLHIFGIFTIVLTNSTLNLSELMLGPGIFNAVLGTVMLLITYHNRRLVRFEQQMRESSEARFRQLFEYTPIAIWDGDFCDLMTWFQELRGAGILDIRDYLDKHPLEIRKSLQRIRINNVNQAALSLFGAEDVNSFVKNIEQTFTDETMTSFKEEVALLFERKTEFEFVYTLKRLDGQAIRVLNSLHVILENGQPDYARVITALADITEQSKAEAQNLQVALERERMSLVNRLLLAVSHDFRTSLSNIEANRYLIQKSVLAYMDDPLQNRLDRIRDNVFRVTEQLENLSIVSSLIYSRATTIDLNQLVQDIIAFQINTSGTTVRVNFEPDRRLSPIMGYQEELKHAIHHLLMNAITYTPEDGEVRVRTIFKTDSVTLEVKDTGIGIAPEHLPHIFDMFYRADASRPVATGGVGLGLSIVKMVTDGHRGSLVVESALGKGSTFTFTIPISQQQGILHSEQPIVTPS